MKTNIILSNKGFTLIELMIVITVMSILITPFIYFEIKYSENFYSIIKRQNWIDSGNRSCEWISKDFRTTLTLLNQWENQISDSTRLILKQNDNAIVIYNHNKENNKFIRQQYTNHSNQPVITEIADNIQAFEYTYQDPLIQFQLKLPDNTTIAGTAVRRIR